MKITAEPRSDQWNADDFTGGPRTFTVAGVKDGAAEQKYDIELVEGGGRVWRPPVTMLRILLAAWGDESAAWAGRRVTLYQDSGVRFGKEVVGGIRISHLSHIEKPETYRITTTRGRRASFTVQPLAETAPPATGPIPQQVRDTVESITDAGTLADYIAHLTTNGAPAHIIEWATAQKKESK